MTPERLDEIRLLWRLSRLAAPDAAVTKALEELIATVAIDMEAVEMRTRHQATQRQQLIRGMQGMGGIGQSFGQGLGQQLGGLQQDPMMARTPYMMVDPGLPDPPPKPWWKLW